MNSRQMGCSHWPRLILEIFPRSSAMPTAALSAAMPISSIARPIFCRSTLPIIHGVMLREMRFWMSGNNNRHLPMTPDKTHLLRSERLPSFKWVSW